MFKQQYNDESYKFRTIQNMLTMLKSPYDTVNILRGSASSAYIYIYIIHIYIYYSLCAWARQGWHEIVLRVVFVLSQERTTLEGVFSLGRAGVASHVQVNVFLVGEIKNLHILGS